MSDGMIAATAEAQAARGDSALHDAATGAAPALDRNRGLDALRGMSIVFVVIHHLAIRIPLTKTALADFLPAWLLKGLIYNGGESVAIFFVISGFLITRRSLGRWGDLSALSAPQFYLQRASRILPTLLLVVALLSTLHLLGTPYYVIDKPNQSLGGAIFAAVGFHVNWYEGRTGYLPGGWNVMWSLAVEEVFYLAFPLVCLTLGKVRWMFVAVLAALVFSMPFVRMALHDAGGGIWYEEAYLPGMSAIALGVLAAMLATRIAAPPRWLAQILRLLGGGGLGMIFFAGAPLWHAMHEYNVWLLIGSAASLILGLHWQASSPTPWRLRSLGWLCSCGRLSYEIYLFHMFVVFALVAAFRSGGFDMRWGFLWYVPALALSWLLGLAIARGFSQPCERWLRRRFAPAGTRPFADRTAAGQV
jgi:peptidoglycan/LPS O-acetylase OafA/YrhL